MTCLAYANNDKYFGVTRGEKAFSQWNHSKGIGNHHLQLNRKKCSHFVIDLGVYIEGTDNDAYCQLAVQELFDEFYAILLSHCWIMYSVTQLAFGYKRFFRLSRIRG